MDFAEYLSFLNLKAIATSFVCIIMFVVGVLIFIRIMRTATKPKAQEKWAMLGYRPAENAHQISMFRVSDHQIREYNNWVLHYSTSRKAGIVSKFSESWVCVLPYSARFGLQVVEKNEAPRSNRKKNKNEAQTHSFGSSVGRAVRSFAWYNWKQHFTERLVTGDPQFDARFAVLGMDVNASRTFLSNPIVRDALLSLKHVDLSIAGSEVRFEDPFKSNTMWIRGATIENLGIIHNQIAEIVTRAASAAA